MSTTTEWMDEEPYPGPAQYDVDWSVLSQVFTAYGRAFGKAYEQLQACAAESFSGIREFLTVMDEVGALIIGVDPQPDTRHPFVQILEHKKKGAHEASKFLAYDHRGRRWY